MKKTKYIVGRSNLACTIFVPFDCANNCPFCTSKEMYKNGQFKFDVDAIIEQIKVLNLNYDITEYVMTGGEPFADLETLKRIIEACQKPVFINTTLPLFYKNIDDVIDFINNSKKVRGVNISRHLNCEFKGVADIGTIDRITKPVRINTVISPSVDEFVKYIGRFVEFVDTWGSSNRIVNLRADYKNITLDNLRTMDKVEECLAGIYTHCGGGGCLVCNTVNFDADTCEVHYHRGRMYSSVQLGDKIYVNDIIMAMDGTIYKDWDFVRDEEFEKWIQKKDGFKECNVQVTISIEEGNETSHYVSGLYYDDVSLSRNKEKAIVLGSQESYDKLCKILNKKLGDLLIKIEKV